MPNGVSDMIEHPEETCSGSDVNVLQSNYEGAADACPLGGSLC